MSQKIRILLTFCCLGIMIMIQMSPVGQAFSPKIFHGEIRRAENFGTSIECGVYLPGYYNSTIFFVSGDKEKCYQNTAADLKKRLYQYRVDWSARIIDPGALAHGKPYFAIKSTEGGYLLNETTCFSEQSGNITVPANAGFIPIFFTSWWNEWFYNYGYEGWFEVRCYFDSLGPDSSTVSIAGAIVNNGITYSKPLITLNWSIPADNPKSFNDYFDASGTKGCKVVCDGTNLDTDINTGTSKVINYLAEGSHSVSVTAYDKEYAYNSNGNPSSPTVLNFTVDNTGPTGSILINNGADYTGARNVNLALSASDAGCGVSKMYISDGNPETDTGWVDFAVSYPWKLTGNDGKKTITVKYIDKLGNESAAIFSSDIILDTTSPIGTIAINNGETYTASRTVTLSLSAGDANGYDQMCFSNCKDKDYSNWEAYNAAKSNLLLTGEDGIKTVYGKFMDKAGNISTSEISDTITLDTTPPTGSIAVQNGASYTNTISVTLNLTASDTNGIAQMCFSNFNDDRKYSNWEEFNNTKKAYLLTSGNGTKVVYVKFMDQAGNISTSEIKDPIILDTSPPAGSVTIQNGATYTNNTHVTLSLNAVDIGDSGLADMSFSNDNVSYSEWESYGPAKAWDLTNGDGIKNVYVKYRDNAGNISNDFHADIMLDTMPPTGSIAIKDGADAVNLDFVTLNLSAGDASGVFQMRFSNDGKSYSDWEAYGAIKNLWSLTNGDGTKTVFVQYRDNAGNISTVSDTVVYDETAPGGTIAIEDNAGYTNKTKVTLTLTSADNLTGVTQMCFSNDNQTYSEWEPFNDVRNNWPFSSEDGVKTVYVKYQDGVGNISAPFNDVINLDNTAPCGGEVIIQNRALCVSDPVVSLTLSASDTGSGVAWMQFSNDGITFAEWEAYNTVKNSWLLMSGDGAKTVYVKFKDAMGNISATVNNSIVLDTTPPVVRTNISASQPGQAQVLFTSDLAQLKQSAPVVIIYDENTTDTTVESVRYKWNPADREDPLTWDMILVQPGAALPMLNTKNTLSLYVTDKWGNSKTISFSSLVIDGAPPAVNNVLLANYLPAMDDGTFLVNKKEIPVTWSAMDNTGGAGLASIKYGFVTDRVASTERFKTFSGALNPVSYQGLTGDDLIDGHIYYVAIAAVDRLGNESLIAYSAQPFLFDGSAPVLTDLQVRGYISYENKRFFSDIRSLTASVQKSDPESGIQWTQYALQDGTGFVTDWVIGLENLSNQNLTPGNSYSVAVKVTNGTGLTTIRVSEPLLFDNTSPEIVRFVPDFTEQRDKTSLSGVIQVKEQESGPVTVLYAIGTTPGGVEISSALLQADKDGDGWLEYTGVNSRLDYLINGLNLSDDDYYLTVKALNIVNLAGNKVTCKVTVNSSLPPKPIVYDDGEFTPSKQELHALWQYNNAPFTIDHYEYRVITLSASNSAVPVTDWANAGITTEAIVTGLNLTDGINYYMEVRAVYTDNTYSEPGRSNGVQVDSTPPVINLIHDGEWASSDSIPVDWTALDNESGIKTVEGAIGTAPGETDVTNGWIRLPSFDYHLQFTGDKQGQTLVLQNGRIYYVTIRVTNWAGVSVLGRSDGVTVDATPPPAPVVRDQGQYHNLKGQLSASWSWDTNWQPYNDPESGISKYEVAVTNQPDLPKDAAWQIVTGAPGEPDPAKTSFTYPGLLADGQTYYFFVRVTNRAGVSTIGHSDGITIDGAAPSIPIIDDGTCNYYNSGNISVTFTATDNLSGIGYFSYAEGTPATVDTAGESNLYGEFAESFAATDFPEGQPIIFRARSFDATGNVSSGIGYSDGFIVDTTPPSDFTVADEGEYIGDMVLRFSWTLPTSNTPLKQIRYAIVTDSSFLPSFTGTIPVHDPHKLILNSWVQLTGICRTIEVFDNAIQTGNTYYIRVMISDMAGNESMHSSDGIKVDVTPPSKPDGMILTGKWCSQNIHASFNSADAESGVGQYEYALGSSRGGAELSDGWQNIVAKPWTGFFPQLINGQSVYLSIRAKNGAGLYSELWSSMAVTVDLTPPDALAITLPAELIQNGYLRSQTLRGVRICAGDRQSLIDGMITQLVPDDGVLTNHDFESIAPQETLDVLRSFEDQVLSDGNRYKVIARIRNGAGEWSEVSSPVFTVDITSPALTFDSNEITVNYGENITVNFNLNESANVHFILYGPDGKIHKDEAGGPFISGANSFSFIPAYSGVYRLTGVPADIAGNEAPTPVSKRIYVNFRPVITVLPHCRNVLGEINKGTRGQILPFTANATDVESSGLAFKWNFGDGSVPGNGMEVTHSFTALGIYTVVLTVTDPDNGVTQSAVTVEITNTCQGQLYTDEKWEGSMSLTGDVLVPPDFSLTIAPGARVNVGAANMLRVQGSIEASDPNEGIVFDIDGAGSWKGIMVEGRGTFEGVTVSHAFRGLGIIAPAQVTVARCIFQYNSAGIQVYKTIPSIIGCSFVNNEWYGIKEDKGSPKVIDCAFTGNGMDYYHETLTGISMEQLNALPGNRGNHRQ